MGFKDLFKNYKEDDNYGDEGYGEEYADNYDAPAEAVDEPVEEPDTFSTPAGVGNVGISGSSIELRVVRPETFKSVDQIADHLLARRTVVLNLEAAGKDTAKRLIDFLTGVAYAIRGDIRKVSNNTYVITPGNVTVSGDALGEAAVDAEAAEDAAH